MVHRKGATKGYKGYKGYKSYKELFLGAREQQAILFLAKGYLKVLCLVPMVLAGKWGEKRRNDHLTMKQRKRCWTTWE